MPSYLCLGKGTVDILSGSSPVLFMSNNKASFEKLKLFIKHSYLQAELVKNMTVQSLSESGSTFLRLPAQHQIFGTLKRCLLGPLAPLRCACVGSCGLLSDLVWLVVLGLSAVSRSPCSAPSFGDNSCDKLDVSP